MAVTNACTKQNKKHEVAMEDEAFGINDQQSYDDGHADQYIDAFNELLEAT